MNINIAIRMPDGVMKDTTMVQNVYMTSLAFLIPLQKVKTRYRRLRIQKHHLDMPFILYPNAECKYWHLEKWLCAHSISDKKFYFNSYFNGVDSIVREIEVRPWLMELNLGRKQNIQYYIVLTIAVDKVFGNKNNYTTNDFCTEFDIVNLKKAIFDNGDNGPFENEDLKGMRFSEWVLSIINEIEGNRRKEIQPTNSIVEICTQQINITANNNTDKINKDFTTNYYHGTKDSSIEDYLKQNIILYDKTGKPTITSTSERNFVYGLLYANDNFMMTHTDTVENVLESYYSNNKVEKYWADDESIVHIKTGSPYYHSKNQDIQKLSGNLNKDFTTLLEMGMLIYIKRRMQVFLAEHNRMSLQEIEYERGSLASLFYSKLFNQTEMDNRMDYFIKGFRLSRMFKEALNITNSTGNSKRLLSLKHINFWTLFIGVSTLIATIIGIIVSD